MQSDGRSVSFASNMTEQMADYIPRMMNIPQDHFLLLGPRGTGKSTWLRHTFPEATLINLLLPDLERKFRAQPERLEQVLQMLPPGAVLILDEIQRVPELLPLIHDMIERQLGIRFILTGSSIRKLRRLESDLLGGRAILRKMGPFVAAELGEQFDVDKALRIGLVPSIWESKDPQDRLDSFVSTYLREEVLMEGFVRKLGDFHRFVEVVSFSQGQQLNTSEVAREAQVARTTVEGYLQILYDLLLAFELPVFTRRAQRALVTHPKFYFFDCGIFRAIRPSGPLDKEAELEGPALETLVAQHLRFWIDRQSERYQFAYWRTRGGVEVDFVVYGPKGLWAIEVKRSSNISRDDLKGLKAFKEDYPEAECILVHHGGLPSRVEGVRCVPVASFLRQILPDQPLVGPALMMGHSA